MTQNARKLDEYLPPVIRMQIASANPYAKRTDQCESGWSGSRFGHIDQADGLQCGKLERLHVG